VKQNPFNYDSWFDYLRLVESDGRADDIREIYERAIANVPPSQVSCSCQNICNILVYVAVFVTNCDFFTGCLVGCCSMQKPLRCVMAID